MLKIGSANIDTNVFLAPLAGCADLAYRLIMREHGAKFCFFEMVDANSVVRSRSHKTLSILSADEKDSPIAAQVLGEDSPIMLEAAQRILDSVKVSFIDVNAACPVKKVIKKKAGSYLLKTPETLERIIKRLASSLPVPVTVKIRSGFESTDLKHLPDIAKRCEAAGAAAIFIHGRTRSQGYTGKVDYRAIRSVKNAVKVPVLGSGDVFTPELAETMLNETGCDGVLVARGSLGNPWIFKAIEERLTAGREMTEPDLETRIATLKRHLEYIRKYRAASPSANVSYSRKFISWYMKNFDGAAALRAKISVVKTYEEVLKLLDSIKIRRLDG